MNFDKNSKQFTKLLKKLGSKKTKDPIDHKNATTLEILFKRFLFILKHSVLHHKNQSNGKKRVQSSQSKTNKHKKDSL